MSTETNRKLLDEIAAAGGWFHARKTKAIWSRKLDANETIETLEGPVDAESGDYLCRGEVGELWPQSFESLTSRYTATDETDGPWRRYAPHPDNKGVVAARVDRVFSVQAEWGELTGKPGDFVLKNYDDRDTNYPEDVWIVDANLFEATYERVTN